MGNIISDLIKQDQKYQIHPDEHLLLNEERAYKKIRNIIQVQQPTRKTIIKNLVATSKPANHMIFPVLRDYYTQYFSISFFNSNEIQTVEQALKNDEFILKMGFTLFDEAMSVGIQTCEVDLQYAFLLSYLNNAHTAFSLIQQQHIFVDCLRCKLKQLSKQKSLSNFEQIVKFMFKAVIKVA